MSPNDRPFPRPRPEPKGGGRRPYSTPKLVRLGTLAEITLAVTDTSQMSDSGGPHLKT